MQNTPAMTGGREHERYDVFLSYNAGDRAAAEGIALQLQRAGLKPFLDIWHIVPGDAWQERLEDALDRSRSCAVLLGRHGLSPWQNIEMRSALEDVARMPHFRVIPVLLPGARASDPSTLPRFLRRLSWVDLSGGIDNPTAIQQLVLAVRNEARKPDVSTAAARVDGIVHPLPPAPTFVGRERELLALRSRWDASRPGVVALIGLGGAGKTALASEFLLQLRDSDARPDTVFVWSFYVEPDGTYFTRELEAYLGTRRDRAAASVARVGALAAVLGDGRRHLLILDGLETVQRERADANGLFASVEESLLRMLVLRLGSYGGLGRTLCIVTSRFPISDLDPWVHRGYESVDLEQLERAAAVRLLRARGVLGSDAALSLVVDQCGSHALTVDYRGIYISEFCGGDPSRAIGPDLPSLDSPIPQEHRLARVLRAYEFGLTSEELALLSRVCIFRYGVSLDDLHAMFSTGGPGVAGPLAALDIGTFRRILRRLAALHLVIREARGTYTVHPAIRAFFGRRFAHPEQAHEAATRYFSALAGAPTSPEALDKVTLDRLEELVFHTLQTPARDSALDLYESRLRGPCRHEAVTESDRGYRVTGMFLQEAAPGQPQPGLSLRGDQWANLLADRAFFAGRLGLLDEASTCYEQALAHDDCHRHEEARDHHFGTNYRLELARTLILSGRLARAAETMREAEQHTHVYSSGYEEDERTERAVERMERIRLRSVEAAVNVLRGTCTVSMGIRHVHLYSGGVPLRRHWWTPPVFLLLLNCYLHQIPDLNACVTNNGTMRLDTAMLELLTPGWSNREASAPGVAVTARQIQAMRGTRSRDARLAAIDRGIEFCRQAGLGLLHIVFLNERAECTLASGDGDQAEAVARMALDGCTATGEPLVGASRPLTEHEMPGARHPDCQFAWGEARALHNWGASLLARCRREEARDVLRAALSLRERLGDPAAPATRKLVARTS